VPILPDYTQELDEEKIVLKNYEGKLFVYNNPRR
jgi:hypothetical protein